jgi:NADH dehydrogenase/NADH:ubiquinone oxidoreductase subunit G
LCGLLEHKNHHYVEIQEGVKILQKEFKSHKNEQLQTAQEMIKKIEISSQQKIYEKEISILEENIKKLKQNYEMELSKLENRQWELKQSCEEIKSMDGENISQLLKWKHSISPIVKKVEKQDFLWDISESHLKISQDKKSVIFVSQKSQYQLMFTSKIVTKEMSN